MDSWKQVRRGAFPDELQAESFMMDNCLENGFYRHIGDEWVVYEMVLMVD